LRTDCGELGKRKSKAADKHYFTNQTCVRTQAEDSLHF
jgi:hypothetical protein